MFHVHCFIWALQGEVSRAECKEGRPKEIQPVLTFWKDRSDLLPPDFRAVLSSQVLPPPEHLLPDETSTLPGKPSLQPHQVTTNAAASGASPDPDLDPHGESLPSTGWECGWGAVTRWRQSSWLEIKEVSLWVPRAFIPHPQNSGSSKGEVGLKGWILSCHEFFFFQV